MNTKTEMKLDTRLLPMMMMMRFDEVISFQQFFFLHFMELVFISKRAP